MHTDDFSATLRERYKARQQQKQAAGSKRIAAAVAAATEPTRPRKQKASPKPRRTQQRRTQEYVKKERICRNCNEPFNPHAQAMYCGKEECQAAKTEAWRINKKKTDAARYRRTRKVSYEPRICRSCDKEFVPKRANNFWCSDRVCQNRRRNKTNPGARPLHSKRRSDGSRK